MDKKKQRELKNQAQRQCRSENRQRGVLNSSEGYVESSRERSGESIWLSIREMDSQDPKERPAVKECGKRNGRCS